MYNCNIEILYLAIKQVYPESILRAKRLINMYGAYNSDSTIIGCCCSEIDDKLDSEKVINAYYSFSKLKAFI
jgi:hypothetical protein